MTNERKQIAATIKCLIKDHSWFHDEISDSDTYENLYLDSLDVVEIVVKIEKHFGCPIPDEALDTLKPVTTVGEFINKLLKYIQL